MNTWPKRCTVCQRKYMPGEWTALPFVGYMPAGETRLELRNCSCCTTLSVHVQATGLPWTLAGELAEVLRNDARDLEGFAPLYTWPPRPRREVTDAEQREADRLYDVADDLQRGVDAFRSPEWDAA